MKKIIILVLFLLAVSFICKAQEKQEKERISSGELDIFGKFAKDENMQGNALLFLQSPSRNFPKNKNKYTYLFNYEDRLSEILVGISHEFLPHFFAGVSGGFELNTTPTLRMGLSVYYKTEDVIAEALYEHGEGAKNYWYKVTLGYQVVPDLTLGLRAQKGIGIGTFAQLKCGQYNPYIMYGTDKVSPEEESSIIKDRRRVDNIAIGVIKEF